MDHYTLDSRYSAIIRDHVAGALSLASGTGQRLDAVPTVEGATALLAKELQQVSAVTFDVLRNPILARTFVPFVENIAPHAETWAYDQFDGVGSAAFIHDYSSDFPKSDVSRKRFSFPVREIGTSYHYTRQDLLVAAAGHGRLDSMRAVNAREIIERKIDDLVAFGDALHGIRGLAGQTDFTAVTPITGSWSASTTAAQLMADLDKLTMAPELATAGKIKSDTLVLPLSVKTLLTKPWSTGTVPTPIWKAWLDTQGTDGITSISYWNRLNLANAGGTGGRALAYNKRAVRFLLSFDFLEFPRPSDGLLYEVRCIARLGGLAVPYPLGTAYMDIQ